VKALDVLTDIIKNKNLAKEYALQESKDLRVLSPKKDTALACLLSGIEAVETIPTWVKTSWFNWIFYAMRMISDKEVDALQSLCQRDWRSIRWPISPRSL